MLHVDHVRPRSLGGDDNLDNLLTACQDCNLGKGKRPLDAGPVRTFHRRPKLRAYLEGLYERDQADYEAERRIRLAARPKSGWTKVGDILKGGS